MLLREAESEVSLMFFISDSTSFVNFWYFSRSCIQYISFLTNKRYKNEQIKESWRKRKEKSGVRVLKQNQIYLFQINLHFFDISQGRSASIHNLNIDIIMIFYQII